VRSPFDSELLMRGGNPTDRALCPTCGALFSTTSNFDRHLTRNRNRVGFAGSWCRPRAEVGLIQTALGIWQQPGSDDAVEALRSSRLRPQTRREPSGAPRGRKTA
jgi:hypothetical protein